ncbi:MAG: hypothetical protein WBP45_11110 [Daejeonella sp.]
MAKTLPYVPSGNKRKVLQYGKMLLKNNPGQTTISGKKIDPDRLYTVKENIPVNHIQKLEAAYLMHGLEGVKIYADAVFAMHKQTTNIIRRKKKVRRLVYIALISIPLAALLCWLFSIIF